jgi:hypothetical protein
MHHVEDLLLPQNRARDLVLHQEGVPMNDKKPSRTKCRAKAKIKRNAGNKLQSASHSVERTKSGDIV